MDRHRILVYLLALCVPAPVPAQQPVGSQGASSGAGGAATNVEAPASTPTKLTQARNPHNPRSLPLLIRDDTLDYDGTPIFRFVTRKGTALPTGKLNDARKFQSNGLARVKWAHFPSAPNRSDWGLINTAGKAVVKGHYAEIEEFRNGRARFLRKANAGNRFWGFLDESGREAIPSRFLMADHFSEGLAPAAAIPDGFELDSETWELKAHASAGSDVWVRDRRYSDEGKIIVFVDQGKDRESARFDVKWGLIDREGRWIVSPRYDDIRYGYEGRFAVKVDNRWGVIDRSGNELAAPRYAKSMVFWEGLAAVALTVSDKPSELRWGFIDLLGRERVPPQFQEATRFVNGSARVRIGDKWTYLDTQGRLLMPAKFEHAGILKNGIGAVKENGGWTLIRTSGEPLSERRYEDISRLANQGLYEFSRDGKVGWLDPSGREVIPAQFDESWLFSSRGVAVVRRGQDYGVIDRSGAWLRTLFAQPSVTPSLGDLRIDPKSFYWDVDEEEVQFPIAYGVLSEDGTVRIDPNRYAFVGAFSEGLAPIRTRPYADGSDDPDAKWGYVDEQGKEIVAPQYAAADRFSDGFACVRTSSGNKGFGFIDRTGNPISAMDYQGCGRFFLGHALVRRDRKVGVIDMRGKEVITPQFAIVLQLTNGQFAFSRTWERFGIMDASGNVVVHEIYDGVASDAEDYDEDFDGNWYEEGQFIRQTVRGGIFGEGLLGHGIVRNRTLAMMRDGKRELVDTGATELVPDKKSNAIAATNYPKPVERNGKWGYEDSNGQSVIAARFDEADDFDGDAARVRLGKKWGLVGRNGKWMVRPIFDSIYRNPQRGNNSSWVLRQGKWGVIDHRGRYILAPRFSNIKLLEKGPALAVHGHQLVLIDSTALRVIHTKVKIDRADSLWGADFGEDTLVRTDRAIGLLGRDGHWIRRFDIIGFVPYVDGYDEHTGLIRLVYPERIGYLDAKRRWIVKPNI